MEVKYPIVLWGGLAICVILIAVAIALAKRKKKFVDGRKVSGMQFLENDPYFKRKKIEYYVMNTIFIVSLCASLILTVIILARPIRIQVVDEERYARDIILCMDISTSVDDLNKNLVKQLKNTVKQLQGERFGIVLFNTSPVLLVPLTDDYQFVIEQLDIIEKALKQRNNIKVNADFDDNYFYYMSYLTEGTLVGAEDRGSSLIGDGLASCLNDFSKTEDTKTKIIIFTTDNDLAGDPLFTLKEAGEVCKEQNAVVYGVGTKEMSNAQMAEMKEVSRLTGGQFFLEEESGTFSEIVNQISKQSQNLVKGKHQYRMVDCSERYIRLLVISTICALCFGFLLRK